MALALLMSCLELPNAELHDHQMAFVYPNFVMLSCWPSDGICVSPYLPSKFEEVSPGSQEYHGLTFERRDSFHRRLDLPWSQQLCWSFLNLLRETLLCSWWNEHLYFGFQVQCRDRYSHRANARWFGPPHPHTTRETCRKLHLHCKLCQHRNAVQGGAYQNVWWVLHIKIRLRGDNFFFRNDSKWPPGKIVVLRELNYIHRQS